MQSNVGTTDRVVRVLLGAAMIGASVLGASIFWGLLGVVLLGTGIFRFCPAYIPLGLNTCKHRR